MTIQEAILRMVGSTTKPEVLIGSVKSFDSSKNLVTVELNQGGEIDEVRIQAVVNSETSGIYVEPKIGSYVLLLKIEQKIESLFVVGWSEIVSYKVMADDIQFNGDGFGGLVKSEKVADEDKKIIDEINSLKQILAAWAPTGTVADGTALKASLASWYTPLVSSPKSQYENNKVKHG